MELEEDVEERVKAKKAKEDILEKRAKEGGRQVWIASFLTGFKPLPQKVKDKRDDNLVEYLICENEPFETVLENFL